MKELQGIKIDLFLNKRMIGGFGIENLLYNIFLKNTKTLIGRCDVRLGYSEDLYYLGNIGFFIDEQYRGNGFAVEAVELLKAVFKENDMNRIYIVNNPDNRACIRVCEKLGAKFIKLVDISTLTDIVKDDETNYKNIWELKL